MMNFFRVDNVTKRYSNHLALNKVSIAVPRQSIFGLLGPNGAGKTTLIRIINQIMAPDEGQIYFEGAPLSGRHIAQIGYLPEERGLYKKMKVGEQAIYLAQLKGLEKKEAVEKLKSWFDKFDILSWWDRKVEELSKGMQQKVQFIITVLHKPNLLIFDEPFSGFDPINANLLKEEILKLKEEGATVIFSTHNMSSVEELCDHIALINNANKILDGKVNEIKKDFRTNVYEVEYSGFNGELSDVLKNNFKQVGSEEQDDHLLARIQISERSGSNDLLETLIPHMNIHTFTEIMPTMNDVFIRVVNESTPENKNPDGR